jgi:hypothetical protein
MNVERKYGLLRAIAIILKVLAWIVLIAGIIGLIGGLGAAGRMGAEMGVIKQLAAMGSWVLPVLAIVWFIQLYAFGSIISLLIDVEENTRAMAAQPPA